MKNKIFLSISILVITTDCATAQIVFDPAVNSSVNQVNSSVQQNVKNTNEIKDTNKKMLEAMTKDKETNMQSSDKSTGKTPSPAAATKSLTQWNKQAINGAKGIMYGLRAGDQIIDLAAPQDSDLAKANNIYTGSVNLLETLILIAETINNDVEFREKDMAAAAAQVGKAPDIKASMDQNTFVQIENTRALNQLISAQNYSLSATGAGMRDSLTRQAEAGRMLAYKDFNPFK